MFNSPRLILRVLRAFVVNSRSCPFSAISPKKTSNGWKFPVHCPPYEKIKQSIRCRKNHHPMAG